MEEEYITIPGEVLKAFTSEVLEQMKLPRPDAEAVADTLVEADLRGVHSHGTMRIPNYVGQINRKVINPQPNIRVVRESPTLALVDGDNGMGQVVSMRAMQLAIQRAKGQGMAAVVARRSTHFGAAAHYAMMALQQDMIGFCTTNAAPSMAPTGGKTLTTGNNPFAWAFPAGEELPIVLDMALSVVARGKIRLAYKKGQKIPLGWATDLEGQPTDDPAVGLKGLLLPIGGYKGYGLAVVMDALSGVLSGANFGSDIPLNADYQRSPNLGQFFMAIDVSTLMPVEEFKARVDRLVSQLKSSQLAKGAEHIYAPGEIEYKLKKERLVKGIPLAAAVVHELRQVAGQLKIKAPFG